MLVVVPPAYQHAACNYNPMLSVLMRFSAMVMKRDAKNREYRHVLATVANKGETNEQVMSFIMDKTLEQIFNDKKCMHCVDRASSPHCTYAPWQQLC